MKSEKSFLLSSKENWQFSTLRGYDLQDVLFQIENIKLFYRNHLGLPNTMTFGVEIEYEGVIRNFVDKYVTSKLNEWLSTKDGSLVEGGEINSPIMIDTEKNWNELAMMCDYLKRKHADVSHNAGGHIHIGAHYLGNDLEKWRTFIKTYAVYENVLFRFLYGDKLNGRKKIYKYAEPLAEQISMCSKAIDDAPRLKKMLGYINKERRQAINFWNIETEDAGKLRKGNSIEFRSPNATVEKVIWQNNINALTKFIIATTSDGLDQEYINYKLKNELTLYQYLYNAIDLKAVLEFVDLIFDNNLDKTFFLRQYLKDYNEVFDTKYPIRSRQFIK